MSICITCSLVLHVYLQNNVVNMLKKKALIYFEVQIVITAVSVALPRPPLAEIL